jgi:XTP/dITP diphosphohydrolase
MNLTGLKGRLLLATNNSGKVTELRSILAPLAGIEILTPADLDLVLDVEENGDSYAQNATLKALAFAKAGEMVALADDSGLEVDALDGAPGMYSARYSPKPGATDADRRMYLLENLADAPQPWTARFRCVISIAAPLVVLQNFEGICEGEIVAAERGDGGFGYDPIFQVAGGERTMAELPAEEKNRISHRARAAQAALPFLQQLFSQEDAA